MSHLKCRCFLIMYIPRNLHVCMLEYVCLNCSNYQVFKACSPHHVMRLSTSLSKSSRVWDVRSIPVTDEQRLRSGYFIFNCFIAWAIDRPSTQGRLDYCSLHYVFFPLGESARDPPRICRVRFGTWYSDLVLKMAPFVRIIDPRWDWHLADNVPGAVL